MYRIMLFAAILVAVCSVASPAEAKRHHTDCHRQSCIERVARKQCSQHRVIACIKRAAIHHHQPFGDMLRVARCESSLDPYNEYAGHHGLYQYLSSTWGTTPYRFHWIYSAKWQALATAWMWKVGRRGEWACQ